MCENLEKVDDVLYTLDDLVVMMRQVAEDSEEKKFIHKMS